MSTHLEATAERGHDGARWTGSGELGEPAGVVKHRVEGFGLVLTQVSQVWAQRGGGSGIQLLEAGYLALIWLGRSISGR